MLYFKNVYIYFLSLKKIILKKFIEFFFSTKYYNKSLETKIPSRFFFYPNPYLLSPLVNHSEALYKISKDNANINWDDIDKNKEKNKIHNFLWLNLVDRKNNPEIIQKIIFDWSIKYGNYKKEVWNNNSINLRTISWISNAEIILNNNDKSFEKLFLKCLLKQINFIKKNVNNTEDNKRIASISTIILSGLVFREYYYNFKFGIKELKRLIDNFFDKNGFPKNRNCENLLTFLQYFILIKEWIKQGQEIIPEYLEEIIEKNLVCLNSFKNSSNKLPLVNGATEKNLERFLE